jgi:hypothetical protein
LKTYLKRFHSSVAAKDFDAARAQGNHPPQQGFPNQESIEPFHEKGVDRLLAAGLSVTKRSEINSLNFRVVP